MRCLVGGARGKRRVSVGQWSEIQIDKSTQTGYTGFTRREGSSLPRAKGMTEVEMESRTPGK